MTTKNKSLFIFIQFLNSVILIEALACIMVLVYIWPKEIDQAIFSQLRIAFFCYIFALLFMVFTAFCCFKHHPCSVMFYSIMLILTKGVLFAFLSYVIYSPAELMLYVYRNLTDSFLFLEYIIYYEVKYNDEVTIGYYAYIAFTVFYFIMLIIYRIKLNRPKKEDQKW